MKRLAIRILILVVVCLICLGSVELLLRFFRPIPLTQPVRHAYTQIIPGLKESIIYDRNEYGLRSLSMKTREKPDKTIRIICLGASTTDQPTQNTADTWSGILETKLNRIYNPEGIRIEIGAYGRGGGFMLHRLDWAAKNLMALEPDIVVVLEGINDLCLNGDADYSYSNLQMRLRMYAMVRSYKEQLFGDPDGDDQDSWFYACREQFQLFRRINILKLKVQLYLAKRSGKVLEWHSQYLEDRQNAYQDYPDVGKNVNRADPFREFADGLAAMISALNQEKIPMLLLTQPTIWKETMPESEYKTLWFAVHSRDGLVRPGMSWLVREMARYNAIQKQHADRMGARLFDLDAAIPKTAEMFFDDCHFTDQGNMSVAEALFLEIKSMIDDRLP